MRCFARGLRAAVAVGWLLLFSSTLPASPPISAPSPLDALLDELITRNAELKSLEERLSALKDEISVAGALEDPHVGFGLLNLPVNTFSFDQEPMTQKQIAVSQKIPWFGKLRLRSERAARAADRQQALLEARRLELCREAAVTFYELAFTRKSLNVNARLSGLVTELLKVAETRYAAGQSPLQDVLQAQVELSSLLEEKARLEKDERSLEDRILGLLNRPGPEGVHVPENLPIPALALETEALKARALENNPAVRIRRTEVEETEAELRLARADFRPDFNFQVAYGQRQHNALNGQDFIDFFSASVMLNVPLWKHQRQDRHLDAAAANHQAALEVLENLLRTVPHQVDALVTDIRTSEENYRLFMDALLLQAGQWAQAAYTAYGVGKVEFNTMITAQMRLLRFQLQAERYLLTVYQKRAELEELLGGPL
jgi:cobalt-zinc-cadmium efflux system outer membrane protein